MNKTAHVYSNTTHNNNSIVDVNSVQLNSDATAPNEAVRMSQAQSIAAVEVQAQNRICCRKRK